MGVVENFAVLNGHSSHSSSTCQFLCSFMFHVSVEAKHPQTLWIMQFLLSLLVVNLQKYINFHLQIFIASI